MGTALAVPIPGYDSSMKKLILIGVVGVIAAVIYKVLTTEVPIKE